MYRVTIQYTRGGNGPWALPAELTFDAAFAYEGDVEEAIDTEKATLRQAGHTVVGHTIRKHPGNGEPFLGYCGGCLAFPVAVNGDGECFMCAGAH